MYTVNKNCLKFLLAFFLQVLLVQPLTAQEIHLPQDSLQLVTVINDHWDDTTAVMRRFQRENPQQKWVEVGQPVPVNLGRTGLAWGSSPLMDTTRLEGKRKQEGDGRSPAGLFPFLQAFGHPAPPSGYGEKNLPFLTVDQEQCVDDGKSAYYNQIVRPDEVGGVTWNSAETMKIDLYEMGLVVGHNCPKAKPGMGSCIFFHLERGPGKPTAGCTSMKRRDLRALLLWLKADKHPVVIQLPKKEFQKRQKTLKVGD